MACRIFIIFPSLGLFSPARSPRDRLCYWSLAMAPWTVDTYCAIAYALWELLLLLLFIYSISLVYIIFTIINDEKTGEEGILFWDILPRLPVVVDRSPGPSGPPSSMDSAICWKPTTSVAAPGADVAAPTSWGGPLAAAHVFVGRGERG